MTLNITNIGVFFVFAISTLLRCQATVHEVVTTSISLTQSDQHRQLQFSNGNTCGVTGFSIYNSITNIWEPLATVVIDGFPQAQLVLEKYDTFLQINIQTHVDMSGCAAMGRPSTIGCVKMRIFNETDYYDYTPPYTLYQSTFGDVIEKQKPAKSGFQHFHAELYEDSSCTGTLICEDYVLINFVQTASTVLRFNSMRATYNGLTSVPSNTHLQQVVSATCNYVKNAIKNGFIVRGSSLLFSDVDWRCHARLLTHQPPTMTYFFYAKFTTSPIISVYDNSSPPTQANISSYVQGLFNGGIPGVHYTETMREFLLKPSTGLTMNPFSNYTSITLIR
jgi:hypothetical protein